MVRPSWKTNLTNAFPIPEDRIPSKNRQQSEPYNYDGEYERKGTFNFLSLPSELRSRIYFFTWLGHSAADKYHKTHPPLSASDCGRLNLTLVSKLLHAESTHFLYSTTTFRLFPLQDFLFLPTPLTLPSHYRSHITSLSLIVGSSWTNPPSSWRVGKALIRCFGRMKLVRILKIHIQVDPSEPFFAKYRKSKTFYTDWCGDLVRDVLKALTATCEVIEVDGNTGVDPKGPLSARIVKEIEASGRKIKWGPDWTPKMAAASASRVTGTPLTTGVSLDRVHALADKMQVMEIKA